MTPFILVSSSVGCGIAALSLKKVTEHLFSPPENIHSLGRWDRIRLSLYNFKQSVRHFVGESVWTIFSKVIFENAWISFLVISVLALAFLPFGLSISPIIGVGVGLSTCLVCYWIKLGLHYFSDKSNSTRLQVQFSSDERDGETDGLNLRPAITPEETYANEALLCLHPKPSGFIEEFAIWLARKGFNQLATDPRKNKELWIQQLVLYFKEKDAAFFKDIRMMRNLKFGNPIPPLLQGVCWDKCYITNKPIIEGCKPAYVQDTPYYEKKVIEEWIEKTPHIAPPDWPVKYIPLPLTKASIQKWSYDFLQKSRFKNIQLSFQHRFVDVSPKPLKNIEFYMEFARRLKEKVQDGKDPFKLVSLSEIPEELYEDVILGHLICPIMKEPIRFAIGDQNNHAVYETRAIQDSVAVNPVSPVTRRPIIFLECNKLSGIQAIIDERLRLYSVFLKNLAKVID